MKLTISKKIIFIATLGMIATSVIILLIDTPMMSNQYERIINKDMTTNNAEFIQVARKLLDDIYNLLNDVDA